MESTKEKLLALLEENRGRSLSGQELALRLGISRAAVWKAVGHLTEEAHLLKGFTRFSEIDGVLVGEIEPKNRVLPLLRPHFCARYPGEDFVLHDRTHREALFYAFAEARCPLVELRPRMASLEEVFLDLTDDNDTVAARAAALFQTSVETAEKEAVGDESDL